MMKKLVLAAALVAASISAHAADWHTRFPLPATRLPKAMLGYWCAGEGPGTEDNVTIYVRAKGPEDCVYNGPTHIRPDGYSESWDNCPFTKVEKSPGGYLIYSHCEILAEGDGHGIGKYTDQRFELRIDKGRLINRRLK
jgi:hypothetical protein